VHTLEAFLFRSRTILLCALVALLTGGVAAQATGSLAASCKITAPRDARKPGRLDARSPSVRTLR
jgi:hypothetical protein